MALGTFVYIRDVDNLSDARYCAGMGVDLIGFKFDPKENKSLNPEQFKEISEWISGVKIVGEFGDSTPEEVSAALSAYEVDFLLISDESLVNEFALLDKPLILRILIDKTTSSELAATLNYCSGSIDYFLLESSQNDLQESELSFLNSYCAKFPILLGHGITMENAGKIVTELNLKGISLKGSPEIRPGYKNFDELADILEALEVD